MSSRIFGLTEKFEQNNRKISLANIFLFLSNFCCWFPVLVFCEIRRQSIETCSKKSRAKEKTRHVRNEFFCIAQLYSKTFSLSLYFISFSCFVFFVYRCTLCAPFCWIWWPEPLNKKKNKHKNQFYAICQWRALPRFKYDVFGGCPNVCLWICIRNVYGDGIVLSIYCPSKILNVLKVSVLIHHQHHHRHNSVIADTVHSHTDIILSYHKHE